jgi:hypothetical protein
MIFFVFILAFSILIMGVFHGAYSINSIGFTAKLKEGTFIESNLYFPENETKFTFGTNNKICPANTCKYQFTDGTFSTFGDNDRYLDGTLKIQDKVSGGFISYKYYKLAGTMALTDSVENAKTGQKIDHYHGDLGIDVKDPIFFPAMRYNSQVIYNENSNMFTLRGTSK